MVVETIQALEEEYVTPDIVSKTLTHHADWRWWREPLIGDTLWRVELTYGTVWVICEI